MHGIVTHMAQDKKASRYSVGGNENEYIDAAKAAILQDFDPMVEIMQRALNASREHPAP